jgi:hypothetical protein
MQPRFPQSGVQCRHGESDNKTTHSPGLLPAALDKFVVIQPRLSLSGAPVLAATPEYGFGRYTPRHRLSPDRCRYEERNPPKSRATHWSSSAFSARDIADNNFSISRFKRFLPSICLLLSRSIIFYHTKRYEVEQIETTSFLPSPNRILIDTYELMF